MLFPGALVATSEVLWGAGDAQGWGHRGSRTPPHPSVAVVKTSSPIHGVDQELAQEPRSPRSWQLPGHNRFCRTRQGGGWGYGVACDDCQQAATKEAEAHGEWPWCLLPPLQRALSPSTWAAQCAQEVGGSQSSRRGVGHPQLVMRVP